MPDPVSGHYWWLPAIVVSPLSELWCPLGTPYLAAGQGWWLTPHQYREDFAFYFKVRWRFRTLIGRFCHFRLVPGVLAVSEGVGG